MQELENPMVIDRLWDEVDEIEREYEAERWYRQADDEYDEWAAMREG